MTFGVIKPGVYLRRTDAACIAYWDHTAPKLALVLSEFSVELKERIAGFSPACSPNFYFLQLKPMNRICCRIRAPKLSSRASGRVRNILPGHMTVLLRLLFARGVSSFNFPSLSSRGDAGRCASNATRLDSTFPGREVEPFSHSVSS